MDFGLTFGSVGDFISLAVLVKDIITALDDARGSAKEYRALVQELVTLRLTLEAVRDTCEDPQLTQSLEDLARIALDTVAHIKDCLSGFLGQIQKYEPALSASASGKSSSLKMMGRKLQWRLNERDIEKFRAEVMGCTMALKVLLEVITVRVLQRNHNAFVKEKSATDSRTTALIRQTEASLKTCMSFIGRKISSRLVMVHRTGIELKRSVDQIIAMISSIAGDLSNIRAIVMGLDRGLSDEYFVLEDITGRIFPIHLRTITSWAVLEFILIERFKGKKGARRVQRKLYSLRESNTQREIDGSIPWESAFLPHQKITMSLICKEADDTNVSGKVTTTCPFCKTPSGHDSGIEVECVKCKRFFTRVVEIDDEEPPSQDQVRSRKPAHSSGHRRNLYGIKDCRSCDKCHALRRHRSQTFSKSGSDSETDSDDEDLQGFVRVHLISGRRRTAVKISNQADSGGYFKLERLREAERILAQGTELGTEEMVVERYLSHDRIGTEVTLDEWDSQLAQHSPSRWPLSDHRAARRRDIVSYKRNISTFIDDDSEEENGIRLPSDEPQTQLDMFLMRAGGKRIHGLAI